jgi:protein-S-isoprenylcysteine O-methyltransferase Ste14
MPAVPRQLVPLLWFVWLVSWWVTAIWSARIAKRLPARNQLPYRALTLTAALLLFGGIRFGHEQLFEVPARSILAWLCVAVVVGGLAFAWWARIHLGGLWSASITRKRNHRIVDTGPYGLVRHPIYTGMLVAALATATLRGTIAGFLGVATLTLSFYIKARLEERFLRTELGRDAYDAYARRVPMLVPFTGTSPRVREGVIAEHEG